MAKQPFSSPDHFSMGFQQAPGIYIPVLFSNITETMLRNIFTRLNVATIDKIKINEKKLKNGSTAFNAFIDVKSWHFNPTANKMRSRLLSGQEVKIVYDNPSFFICKPKHEKDNEEYAISPPPTYIDYSHIAPLSGSQSEAGSQSEDDYCHECEIGMENQLAHSCVQRMIAAEQEEN